MKEHPPASSDGDSASGGLQLPQDLAKPFLLVAAKSTREMRDAEINTEPMPARKVGPYRRESSTSEVYDVEEPLTTKTLKVYKKRAPIRNLAADNSEDSILQEQLPAIKPGKRRPMVFSDETDVPYSEVSKGWERRTDSSGSPFSSSGSFIPSESDMPDLNALDFPLGMLPPHLTLGPGMAFIYMAIPPDGGYGWLVFICSFLSLLIVEGIIFSIGILLPHMRESFDVQVGQVVLVASIQIGCYYSSGVISTALINKYGFRVVALMGILIASMAILVASFSDNLVMMILFYSVFGGPGLSMIALSSQLILGFYFARYRPLASVISSSGCGLGILIFNLTASLLVERIGWEHTLRCHALMVLSLFFCSLAYREVKPMPVGVVHRTEVTSDSSDEYYGNFYVQNFLSNESSRNSDSLMETYDPKRRETKCQHLKRILCPCCVKKDRKFEREEPGERNYIVRADPVQRDDLFYTGRIEYEAPHSKEQFEGKDLELVGSETHVQQAAYRLHNIRNYDSGTETSEMGSINPPARPVMYTRKRAARPTEKKPTKAPEKQCCPINAKMRKALGRLVDYHLLGVFQFRVLLVAAFLYPMGFNIPFLYSNRRSTIPIEYAVLINPFMGGANFVTRCLSAVIVYKLRSWTTYICGGGTLLGGLIVFVSAFIGSDSFVFQAIYAIMFGMASAVFSVTRGIIYVEYLGLSKLTNAVGLTCLAMGIGVFVGSSAGGFLVEITGGFLAAFCFAGVCLMGSGLLMLILPQLVKRRGGK